MASTRRQRRSRRAGSPLGCRAPYVIGGDSISPLILSVDGAVLIGLQNALQCRGGERCCAQGGGSGWILGAAEQPGPRHGDQRRAGAGEEGVAGPGA